jgi:kynurenine formamidase
VTVDPARLPDYGALRARADVPPRSSWGLFGRDDERGMANFAGPAQVVAAAGLITTGTVFSLDYALDAFDPPPSRARSVPVHRMISDRQTRDDVLDGFYPQASSQVDGLRHRRASGFGFYNGVPDDAVRPGSPRLGVQRWAERPIVGRGVLIDLEYWAARAGQPIDHAAGQALDPGLLDLALAGQQVRLGDGDLVLVHTGWARWYLDAGRERRSAVRAANRMTGLSQDERLPQWLWDQRVALIASDTVALEVLPPRPGSPFAATAPEDAGMMHQELIARLGLPIGELWNLTGLAADSRATGRWTALVSVKPLHLTGGAGSPANAIAIR